MIRRLLKKFETKNQEEHTLPKFLLIRVRFVYDITGQIVIPFVYIGSNKIFNLTSNQEIALGNLKAISTIAKMCGIDAENLVESSAKDTIYNYSNVKGGIFEELQIDLLCAEKIDKYAVVDNFTRKYYVDAIILEPLIKEIKQDLQKEYKKHNKKSSRL